MDRTLSDEDLLSAFVEGDDEALAELARRHEGHLLGLARGLLRGSSSPAADAVQETWVRVIRFGHRFDGRSTFKTWLYRIAINRCRDLLARADKGGRDQPLQSRDAHAEQRVEGPNSGTELNGALRSAVEKLAPAQREVLLLCYHHDMTHAQAADVLKIPGGTLKSRLNAGLNVLRERLRSEKSP